MGLSSCRNIKGAFATSRTVASCSPGAQDRLPRYWLLPDDYGCFDGAPPVLRGALFPLRPDVTEAVVASDLAEYERAGMLELWLDGEGRPWGFWRAWGRHQRRYPNSKRRTPVPPSVLPYSDLDAYYAASADRVPCAAPSVPVPSREIPGNPDPISDLISISISDPISIPTLTGARDPRQCLLPATEHPDRASPATRLAPREVANSRSAVVLVDGLDAEPAVQPRKVGAIDQAIEAYSEAFRRRYGTEPVVSKADKGQLGRAMQSWPDGVPSFLRALEDYVADDDPWICEQCHPLRQFGGRINRYRVAPQHGAAVPAHERVTRAGLSAWLARQTGGTDGAT